MRRHTARFLILWLLLLPLALWHLCGWGSVPATAVISFVLLGIEEIGVQIEVRSTALGFHGRLRLSEGSS
jgi:predicted membrane chloride channel (bestrophin family)